MKKVTIITIIAIFAMTLIGCETIKETNSNTAVVVNANKNTNTTAPNVKKDAENKELTREDFEKDKEKYDKEAKEEKSTIGQGTNDLWLWTKVRASLLATDDLRDSTINVDVENDVVTLKGTVGTKAQKDSAVKVAKGIEGVKDVKDQLKVDAKDSLTNQTMPGDGKSEANKSKSNGK